MYKLFGYVNEVEVHNKSRHSDLALEKLWFTHFSWLWLCTTVDMVMPITNLQKRFFMVLREITMKNLLKSDNYRNDLLLISSTIIFQLILGFRKITYPPLMRSMREK